MKKNIRLLLCMIFLLVGSISGNSQFDGGQTPPICNPQVSVCPPPPLA